MTGPECYQEALRLAAESYHEDRFEQPAVLLARAQVFATLALTAANVDLFAPATASAQAWREVTS